jgi:hypothetical protein
MRHKWIKLHTEDWLDGSLRDKHSFAHRGLWADLLAMAGRSKTPGVIHLAPGHPYTHEQLAARLGATVEEFEDLLVKHVEEGRVKENGDGIHIVNWDTYQTAFTPKEKTPAEPPAPAKKKPYSTIIMRD